MKNKRAIRRKGFTLVELLIVIVVIGILSAMMMLSSTEAVSSSKAVSIVNGLRNWKTAALAYYMDNMESVDAGKATFKSSDVAKYLSNGESDSHFDTTSKDGSWFIKYSNIDANTKGKLKTRAQANGLTKSEVSPDNGSFSSNYYDGTGTEVYMFVK